MIDAGTYGACNWVDLSTPNIASATAFYRDLFGWDVATSTTPMGDYHVGRVGEREYAGMMQQGSEPVGSPAVWTTFFFVEDIDETVGKVRDAGGAVLTEPFEIPGDARVAVVADPTGAMLALITGPRPEGEYFSRDPGGVCWIELLTRDTAAAEGFYSAVFGWKAVTEATAGTAYTMFKLDDEDVAGMMMMPDEVPVEAPAHWAVYFTVADCVETQQRAVDLGGQILRPATEAGMGKFAVLADPQGATFHLMDFTA